MTGSQIRARRAAGRISGDLLCRKAAIKRTRLSGIERGYIEPTAAELNQIIVALEDLLRARQELIAVAAEVGWPPETL